MNILVINCGSSSLKYELIESDREQTLWKGLIDRIGLEESRHQFSYDDQSFDESIAAPDHQTAMKLALEALRDPARGMVRGLSGIHAVSHRIAHGGVRFRGPVAITDEVKNEIRRLIPLLPLHHPAMLQGIHACEDLLPKVPQIAVFDTAFHAGIPDEAAIYGLPYEYFTRGIRKFGFHGNSHQYVSLQAARFLDRAPGELNIITCHLGNGSSVAAVQGGTSIDTSMGFGPMAGLLMGSRVGDIDPGIIFYLMRNENRSIDDLDDLLNKRGGLLGISGIHSDMREILRAADAGDQRAGVAIRAYCYRVRLYIGAYMAAMGGCDVVVFTGGIGQNSVRIRQSSTAGLGRLGISIDTGANDRCRVDAENAVCDIGTPDSPVRVLVIATHEELMMARQCSAVLRGEQTSG